MTTIASQKTNNYENFTGDLIDSKAKVNIYLVSGIKLQGVIVYEDDLSFVLSSALSNGVSQKVYKHAVSTIVPVV